MKNNARTTSVLLVFSFLLVATVSSVLSQPKAIKDLRPTVILVSLDGFRYDYLEKYNPTNLNRLARTGVRAKWMIPSFPSKTFPNHYTIATGLYPQNHGIVENNIYDSRFDKIFTLSDREEIGKVVGGWENRFGSRRRSRVGKPHRCSNPVLKQRYQVYVRIIGNLMM